MDRNESSLPEDRKMEHLKVFTDAGKFNEATFSSNKDAEVVASQLVPEDTRQLEQRREESRPATRLYDPSSCYDMSGDKYLIIFNHYKYDKWRQKNFKRPSTRIGTYADVRSLEKTFRNLGFVVLKHDDCTYEEIEKHLRDMCDRDHSKTSCVAVAVMTHGFDTYLSSADIVYPVADITGLVGTAPSLAGKPKLFFLQACREGHIRHETPEDGDNSAGDEVYIPKVERDCLVIYATYLDHVAFRNGCGSWLMQALCKVIDANHTSMNLARMAILVNKKVSAETAELQDGDWRQMSVIEHDLKKFLML